ncbi:hypothetical protein CL176_01110 [Suicoccus acidiformans]|uniref:LysM domain-containing protein n=1 Tax=Suicoccus acidiformans TaxID=2036206 RepID=A0A347WI32_9LACT|nr:LysM peptidoglycan-binding domain-containing protein [Suicoccus acidiformans]AXY24739.1 hypothetical protein CL176_01110 [Suicoccus acidiformans]
MKRKYVLLTSSMSLLAGLVLAVEPQTVHAQFVAPAETSPAYMDDKVVVPQNFDTTAEAIEYAKAHFDWKEHGNWYVRGDQNGGYVYFDRYVEPTGGEVVETPADQETSTPSTSGETPQTPAPSESTHTIAYGDTLWSIARKNNLTVQELKELNGLTSDNVPVGTQLKLSNTTSTQTPAPNTSTQTGGNYRVQAGDSLWKIAQANGTTVDELRRLNNIRGDFLQVGSQLKLPGQTSTTPSNDTPTSKDTTYTVKSGDYLYKIAGQYGVSVAQLKAWNNLTSNFLQVGDVLKVKQPVKPLTPKPDPVPASGRTHTIVAGDTLWDIARANHMTVKELMDLNGLTSTNLPIGTKLKLTSTTPTTPTQTAEQYTVKPGDYLYKIAKQYGVTVAQLKEWNNLTSNFLQVGDVLKVKQPVKPLTPKPDPAPASGRTHTIVAGDTLWDIARANHMTVKELMDLNGLTSTNLPIGTKLKLTSTTPTTPTQTAEQYTVKAGDYLYKIAKQYGVTVAQLKEWNNLTSDFLQVGDKLKVQKSSRKPSPTKPAPEAEHRTHTIVAGDTLWDIARANHMTVKELMDLNGLTSTNLPIGTKLKLTSTTPTTPTQTAEQYTVKPGDYLYKIAKQYGVTVAQLKEWNNLTSDFLQVGDKLKVQKSSRKPSPTKPAPEAEHRTHTIVAGDTLWDIARANHMTVKELMDLNGLTSTNLPIGTILRVNKDTKVPQPSQPSQTYTVKAGDYLYKIAKQYGVTVKQLKEWNNLRSNALQVGDKLTIKTANQGPVRPSQPQSGSNYTVKAGDYLYKIANQYGTTAAAIKRLNNLQSDALQIGDVLKIPAQSGGGSSQTNRQPVTYTVKSGDYLYKIANRYGVTVNQIKAWNNLSSDALQIGDKLVIRK